MSGARLYTSRRAGHEAFKGCMKLALPDTPIRLH